MIRYICYAPKVPPAPFVRVSLRNPHTGREIRDLPAQLDTGADCSLVPLKLIEALGVEFSGSLEITGVGGKAEEMMLYSVLLGIHNLPLTPIEVLSHPDEP